MTPHNEANLGDIAETVLMPGDPLRAKYIADNFLTDVKIINSVRNMFSYTGYYKGKKITVFSSGMGMPSCGIYTYELYKFYNVQNIIRIGTCGAYNPNLNILDTILVDQSYTIGNFAKALDFNDEHLVSSSETLNEKVLEAAKESNINLIKGNTFCSEVFDYYTDLDKFMALFPKDLNLIASEMEAFALFYTAKHFNKNASCLLTVVDSHYQNKEITPEERQTSLNDMIQIALETSLKI